MEGFDCIIIGAGVIGLAVANELAAQGRSVLVLERHNSFGQETSSRNSEVIHGGMYYPQESLKARFCVEGRRLLYDFCSKHAIPYKKIGKIIVATNSEEVSSLENLFKRGSINKVEGLRFITKEEIKSFEPEVSGVAGLYSSETGIIDSHRFMSCLAALAQESGAMIGYNSEFLQATKSKNCYKIAVKNGNEELSLMARIVINSAGLDSDIVARNSGFDLDKYRYNIHYCKGQYFRLSSTKARLLKMLVYPVPKPSIGGLGIHVSVDMVAGVRLGPDDEYIRERVKDYSVDPLRRFKFYDSVSKFLPFILEDDLSMDTAGIRPKLQGPGEDFRDFVISDEAEKGFPGFINLIGIESPGLTASLAIARYVKDKVLRYF